MSTKAYLLPTLPLPVMLVLLLVGCAEVVTCPEGTRRPPRGDGTFESECQTTCVTGDGRAGYEVEGFAGCRPVCVQSDGNAIYCDLLGGDGGLDGGPLDSSVDASDGGRCVEDSECVGDDGPICGDDGACRGCANDGECAAMAGATLCDEASGRCVECLAGDDDACVGEELCDTRAGATQFSCVECLTDAECLDEDEPVCDGGACRGCAADPECTGRTSTPVCDEPGGRCVACTADTEEARCGVFSCSRLTFTCTSTTRDLLDNCEECEADSECAGTRRCVLHRFGGMDVGYFCFLDSADGGCGNTDPARRPYSVPTELVSIDDVAGTYCMPPTTTTCQGIRDVRSVSCSENTACGEVGLDDGLCPTVGPGAGLCSYPCGGGVDCASSLSCLGTPQHCRTP